MVDRIRLLLVDDDPDTREGLAELLEERGYAVCKAPNGQDALTAMQRELPDLVVLDLLMPVMNGWEFCEAKHEDPVVAQIPVIAMSGAVSKDPTSPYFIAVDESVAKPVDVEELLVKISACMAARVQRSA
jgi:two-component system chemotaxis response regulator CheY